MISEGDGFIDHATSFFFKCSKKVDICADACAFPVDDAIIVAITTSQGRADATVTRAAQIGHQLDPTTGEPTFDRDDKQQPLWEGLYGLVVP